MRRAIPFAFSLAVAIPASFTVSGCSPAQSAMWSTIAQTVLKDIENGVVFSAIESAVEALDPAIAGDVAAVDKLIMDVIQYLEDTGTIPTLSVAYADSLKAQAQAKIAAKVTK